VAESELDAARRHVREAEDRLFRQQQLVDGMDRYTDERVKRLGRELLAILRGTVAAAKEHLHLIESGNGRGAR
jgi:hypothetical protein